MPKITNKQELTQKVTFFLTDKAKLEILFYVTTRDNKLLKLDIDGDDANSLIDDFKKEIKRVVIDSEYQIRNYSTSEDRKNCYFVYDLAEVPDIFTHIENAAIDIDVNVFDKNSTLSDLTGFITVFAFGNDIVKLYRPIYNVDKIITKDRHVYLIEDDSRFVKFSKEALSISPTFSILYVDKNFVIIDIDKVERSFNLHQIVTNEAKTLLKDLERISLIENLDLISQIVSENVRLAKKLICTLKTSRVLLNGIPSERIITFAKSKIKQIGKITINEERQVFSPIYKTEIERIIKLLSDDLLKSELTEEEYDSSVKDVIDMNRINNGQNN